MIAIIGSVAAEHQHISNRQSKDLDIVGEYNEVVRFIKSMFTPKMIRPMSGGRKLMATDGEGLVVEAEIAWPGSQAEQLLKLIEADSETEHYSDIWYGNRYISNPDDSKFLVASPSILLLLKMSHRYLRNSPHFLKTMDDIKWLKDEMQVYIRPEHWDFFKERERATYEYAHPKLNVKKDDFFTGDGVKYVYDHDSIHLAMAQQQIPAYKRFQPVGSEVNCSGEMFHQLPEYCKLHAVLEETYVLALERSQIPYPEMDRYESFKMALEKVCTSITSGWFREYAYNNYDAVLEMYNPRYVDRFYEGVEKGIVVKL